MTSASVCICTYRRPDRLRLLLADLAAQTRTPDEIVVVDNDADGSARQTVEAFGQSSAFPVRYEIQPEKNISLTRNRAMKLASGEWLALLDDDERAPPHWLATLLDCAERYQAGCVIAPVHCQEPVTAPEWIKKGRFYAQPRYVTGTVITRNVIGLGNVLLKAEWIRDMAVPVDPSYGLTGGEDLEFIARLERAGCKLVWCEEALVTEDVEPSRLTAQWILRRSLRTGQTYARLVLDGGFEPVGPLGRFRFLLQSAAQMVVAVLLGLLSLPLGRHRSVYWLGRAYANYGKLSLLWGSRYQEYAAAPAKIR